MSAERMLDLRTQIERAAAESTVRDFKTDAIWLAVTEEGAVLRAHLCLLDGATMAQVTVALDRFQGSTVNA